LGVGRWALSVERWEEKETPDQSKCRLRGLNIEH
jgi:hypothetical protein